MLSKTENYILGKAVRYINEVKSAERMNGFAKGKQVKQKKKKKTLKKIKKDGEVKEANPIHVFETLLGAVKMAIVSYLRLDLRLTEIQQLVYGLSNIETEKFMGEIRLSICKDVANHLKNGDLFIRPLEIHRWLYKSSYLSRSSKLAKDLTEINGFAFAEDILALKDHYIDLGRKEITKEEHINEIWGETSNVTATQDSFDFLIAILNFESGIRIALQDIEKQELVDKKMLKRCKYTATQVKTLAKKMYEYIIETQKDIKKHTRDEIELHEIREYRKSFGVFEDAINKSCKLEGIRFIKENEDFFLKYYESLKRMSNEKLDKEMKWLGVA